MTPGERQYMADVLVVAAHAALDGLDGYTRTILVPLLDDDDEHGLPQREVRALLAAGLVVVTTTRRASKMWKFYRTALGAAAHKLAAEAAADSPAVKKRGDILLVVGWEEDGDCGTAVLHDRTSAHCGAMPDPTLTNAEIQSIMYAAKMAFAKCMRARRRAR